MQAYGYLGPESKDSKGWKWNEEDASILVPGDEEITSLHSKITTLEDDLRKTRQEASEYQHLCKQMEKELEELKNNEQQLHGEMCKILPLMYVKVLSVFPELEAARPRSTSGIQALCSLHIELEKTKTVLQHFAECSKIYLAITGDSVVLKFEKARSALEDGLRKVEDIVPQTIGCQSWNSHI